MIKVLFLPKYNQSGASSRYRTHQYIDIFKEKGITCDVRPFFDDEHIKKINSSNRGTSLILLKSILKRFLLLLRIKKYNLVFIEKEIIPYFPPIIETLFKIFNVKYILDYDDAIFHNYDTKGNKIIKFLFKNKIKNIMKGASYIVVGSTYLYDYAIKYNKNVVKVPTVIDIDKYDIHEDKADDKFKICWIGSFYTSRFLLDILDSLINFCKKHDAEVNLIGFNKDLLPKGTPDCIKPIKWEQETETKIINSCSLGISPIADTKFVRGKCAFKSIQYMACGLPVITTPIGSNKEVVVHNENGFHALNNDDWEKYLELLFNDDNLRTEIGIRNRKKIEEEYSIQKRHQDYLNIFNEVNNL